MILTSYSNRNRSRNMIFSNAKTRRSIDHTNLSLPTVVFDGSDCTEFERKGFSTSLIYRPLIRMRIGSQVFGMDWLLLLLDRSKLGDLSSKSVKLCLIVVFAQLRTTQEQLIHSKCLGSTANQGPINRRSRKPLLPSYVKSEY
jgi:hypothetical protein